MKNMSRPVRKTGWRNDGNRQGRDSPASCLVQHFASFIHLFPCSQLAPDIWRERDTLTVFENIVRNTNINANTTMMIIIIMMMMAVVVEGVGLAAFGMRCKNGPSKTHVKDDTEQYYYYYYCYRCQQFSWWWPKTKCSCLLDRCQGRKDEWTDGW